MNFIFFMPDQLRAESIGCYGHPLVATPNLDRVATQGVRFDQCHMQFTLCSPSRCSLMTGWYPHVSGHRSLWHLLRPHEPNLFGYLHEAGYEIAWYGKNDLFSPDSFSVIDTFARRGARYPSESIGAFDDPFFQTYLHKPMQNERHETADMRTLQLGLDFLRARRPGDRPFMLYLPLTLPHPPYTVPEEYYHMYDPADVPPLRSSEFSDKPLFFSEVRRRRGLDRFPEDVFRRVNAVYLGMVSYVDWMLGELLEALEQSAVAEETALFVFSDHGDFSGDWGMVEKWHNALNDPLTRVPLLVRMPGGRPGHTVLEPVELFDVMATVLELAGLEPTHTHFARTLVPQIRGAHGDPDRAVFAEGGYGRNEPHCFAGHASPYTAERSLMPCRPESYYYIQTRMHQELPRSVCRSTMVRTLDWKLIRRPDDVSELYDLKSDPLELVNRFEDPACRRPRRALEQRMLDWYIQTSDVVPFEEDDRELPTASQPRATAQLASLASGSPVPRTYTARQG